MPVTDDDVLRKLLHHATNDLHAPPAVATGIVTRHRRARNARMVSFATTGVAAAAVVATVAVVHPGPATPGKTVAAAKPPVVKSAAPGKAAPATKLPAITLDAAQELDKLSVAAGSAPQLTGRYFSLTEHDTGTGENSTRVSVFDSLTGDEWTYQQGTGNGGQPVPAELPEVKNFSPTTAEFASWPTDPAKLRAFLLSPAALATPAGQEIGTSNYPGVTTDDQVFANATGWLWFPLLPPALRSALYKVLATVPGVQVTSTVDSTGQPAIEMSRYDSFAGTTTTIFEDPSTGAVLEQDWTFSEGAIRAVYASVTSSATLPR